MWESGDEVQMEKGDPNLRNPAPAETAD